MTETGAVTAQQFDQETKFLKGGASMLHPGKTLDPLADWQKAVAYRFADALSARNTAELQRALADAEKLAADWEKAAWLAEGNLQKAETELSRLRSQEPQQWHTDEPPQEEPILALIEYNFNSFPVEEYIVCILKGDALESGAGDDIGWTKEVIRKWMPLPVEHAPAVPQAQPAEEGKVERIMDLLGLVDQMNVIDGRDNALSPETKAQLAAIVDASAQTRTEAAEEGKVACQYRLAGGSCNAPIVRDEDSYSGYRHAHQADWMHWATPVPYGEGLEETRHVFLPCGVCGKLGPENEAHVRFDGHKFSCAPVAEVGAGSRARFEAWARDEMNADPENLERLAAGSGGYRVHNVQCWWMGWQVRDSEVERLEKALGKYGRHTVECLKECDETTCGCATVPCTCGFEDALRQGKP